VVARMICMFICFHEAQGSIPCSSINNVEMMYSFSFCDYALLLSCPFVCFVLVNRLFLYLNSIMIGCISTKPSYNKSTSIRTENNKPVLDMKVS
jgi:hypothetical protein